MSKASLDVRFDMKRAFFDREGIIKAVEAKERRVLIQVGSFVRRTARSSIRTRRRPTKGKRGRKTKPSQPGEPPISYEKHGIKRIFFYYDKATASVGIGPELFDSKDVPGLLELGGPGTIEDHRTGQSIRAHFQPHPFMEPALEANRREILDAFERNKF